MTEKIDLSVRHLPGGLPRSPIPSFSKRNTVVGTLTASGAIFRPNCACTVRSVMVQILSACTIQLLKNGEPSSAAYILPANSIVRFAGEFLSGNEVLSLSLSAGSAVFEVVWLKDFNTAFVVPDTEVFILPAVFQIGSVAAALPDANPLPVKLEPATKATYRAYVSGPTPATGILTSFLPNGTKTVRLTKVLLFGTQATAAIVGIELEKCSTLDTGGTFQGTVHGPFPIDTSDPASSVTLKNYATVPVTGTVIGQIDQVEGLLHASLTIPTFKESLFFGTIPGTKELTLVGTECVHLMTANTFAGGQFFNSVWEWTEE